MLRSQNWWFHQRVPDSSNWRPDRLKPDRSVRHTARRSQVHLGPPDHEALSPHPGCRHWSTVWPSSRCVVMSRLSARPRHIGAVTRWTDSSFAYTRNGEMTGTTGRTGPRSPALEAHPAYLGCVRARLVRAPMGHAEPHPMCDCRAETISRALRSARVLARAGSGSWRTILHRSRRVAAQEAGTDGAPARPRDAPRSAFSCLDDAGRIGRCARSGREEGAALSPATGRRIERARPIRGGRSAAATLVSLGTRSDTSMVLSIIATARASDPSG